MRRFLAALFIVFTGISAAVAANDCTGATYYDAESDTCVACPAGYDGHGADEAADCGHLLKFDGHAIYSRTSKPTTPALNFMTRDGATFYIGLSSTDNTLSKLHVSDGTNQYTAYDDSLIYGERQF